MGEAGKRQNVLQAGVIGTGFIGIVQIDSIRRIPGIRLAAVCEALPERLWEVKERYGIEKGYTDWRELIGDPEIQVVHNCTPGILHDEINRAAILAGKHIYSEKPLSLSAGGAKELWRLAVEHRVAHGVNHQYRLYAAVQEMRARLRDGEGGRPLFVSGCYLQETAARQTDYTPRRMPEDSPARALSDIGIHWADAACFVMGQPVRAVYAQMYTHYSMRRDPVTGKEIEIRSDDTTSVMVRFEDGTPGMAIFSKCMLGHKNDMIVTVSGEAREYTWKQRNGDRLYLGNRESGNEELYMGPELVHEEVRSCLSLPPGHAMGWQDALTYAIEIFYDSIRSGSYLTGPVPYATFYDGWRGNAFIEACVESAKTDCWVELEKLP